MLLFYFILFSSILFSSTACNPPNSDPDPSPIILADSSDKMLQSTIKVSGPTILLCVKSKEAIIRQQAKINAPEIQRYKEGDSLVFANVLSKNTIQMRLGGLQYNEPWLKIILPNQESGWVYGACVHFDPKSHPVLKRLVLNRRLDYHFGEEVAKQLDIYQREIAKLRTFSAFQMWYKRSNILSEQIENAINEQLAKASKDSLPNYFWINDILPGYLLHFVRENYSYKLFKDFRFWHQKALISPQKADEQFIDVYFSAYQTDSIEFLYPDWEYRLENGERYSLLGKGIHFEILEKIHQTLQENRIFEKELLHLKQALIDDIVLQNAYWMPLDAILKELDAILQAKWHFLKKANRIELSVRRNMLKEYAKNGIQINQFEGTSSITPFLSTKK